MIHIGGPSIGFPEITNAVWDGLVIKSSLRLISTTPFHFLQVVRYSAKQVTSTHAR
jgi:hypothetical protein